jgi:enediyne biosynthesis protein E4
MSSSLRAAAAVLLAFAAGCAEEPPPNWNDAESHRWRALRIRGAEPGFTRIDPARSGIGFRNDVSDSTLVRNRYLGQGAGISIGDVDGDGRPDIFMARTEGCNALYRNLGDWHFENIAKTSGVEACDRHSSGTALADIDSDGDLDLIALATDGPNAVFLNDGKARFSERRDMGLDSTGRGGTTIALADVDGDGHLDMYVANYRRYSIEDSIPPQQRSFNQMVREISKGKYDVIPERKNEYKVVLRPDMGGLKLTARGAPDDFYRFTNGAFRRVPFTSGAFRDTAGKPLTEEAESFGLGARFADLNGDGSPDLYVVNDFEDTDQLWINNGRGEFRLADWRSQRQMSNSGMGVDVGDVNGDGLADLFETDMLGNDRREKTQVPTHTPIPKKPGGASLVLQQQRNTMFVNRGDGTFEEVGMAAGVHASGWSWSTLLTDVDLDGWEDILIANGHPWDIMDADMQEQLQNRLTGVEWRRLRWEYPSLKLKNVAFRNRGDMTFEDVSARWRFGTEEDISHAMALGDLDGDGDLDVVVNRLNAPALVLRNDASAPRVAVRLSGKAPNTMAIGAKVFLIDGAVPRQVQEVTAGGIYLSHSDHQMSFAMGKADSATLAIVWPDRSTTSIRVHANREYIVSQQHTLTAALPDPVAPTLFVDETQALNHKHTENAYDDWQRQYLLPEALSMGGPGVSWFDVDRDGDEDLIIGTGKGGRVSIFKNDAGRLVPGGAGPAVPNDVTTILGLAEPGRTRLIAGLSTWEATDIGEMKSTPAVVALRLDRGTIGPRIDSIVSSHEEATGPLAMADYDGDGDLDLFIGGRAIAMQYPVGGSSGFFRNNNGAFELDAASTQLVSRIGLVSSATFADVNGDGHADLLLARDWGSIGLLLNNGRGGFILAPATWGLARWTGRWNGIATGDLDGDGRLDIVATSWGRNTGILADTARPLTLVYGPFGAANEVEMLMGRRDTRLNGLAPITSYARAREAVPSIVQRAKTFSAYADANIDQLLAATRTQVSRLEAVTLDHTVFLNRGDHFEPRAMPSEAQVAPAFYAGVADFDGDGREDVFLAQNFFPTVLGAPRYDAGRSLLLSGDGKGGLAPVPGTKSGLLVYGDQRGAAYSDFDRDGRLDLVVSQNGDATKVFRNKGAKPGLRVRLVGSPANPDGIGAQVRLVYGAAMGPVREVQKGSGYWSENGAVQVFGMSATPTEVWVRWPGGRETRTPIPAGAREITVSIEKR